jgi:hypothetical protein
LAVNAVTSGDFSRPVRIGKFLKELYSGFQLLNLKNDSLRKRFDGIKVKYLDRITEYSTRALSLRIALSTNIYYVYIYCVYGIV